MELLSVSNVRRVQDSNEFQLDVVVRTTEGELVKGRVVLTERGGEVGTSHGWVETSLLNTFQQDVSLWELSDILKEIKERGTKLVEAVL